MMAVRIASFGGDLAGTYTVQTTPAAKALVFPAERVTAEIPQLTGDWQATPLESASLLPNQVAAQERQRTQLQAKALTSRKAAVQKSRKLRHDRSKIAVSRRLHQGA